MQNATRSLFNAYLARIAQLNGVDSAGQKFAATPAVQQKLEDRLLEQSDFLSSINVIGVDNQGGEKLGLLGTELIGSTADTASGTERQTFDPTSLDAVGYFCSQTNFDTHIRYALLDAWRHLPNFQEKVRDFILKAQALTRIAIGFNGMSRAATSDRGANPLMQDVNIGWLQKYRDHAANRVMTESTAAQGTVTYGASGDYKNLDSLVYDAVSNLIEPQYSESTDLVVLVGRGLLHDKYFNVLNRDTPPTEMVASDKVMSTRRLGELPALRIPYFPANTLMVTPLSNLSIYWQKETRRRHVMDNPKLDRVENYESTNEAYVVEDYAGGCVVENITKAD
ncbi:phage major capsid protein, P2 family [Alloalcanivorax xenomutans]|uniref:phage major capsid protein, P2 family n=1 Tax=Alloalcanivorax xenomutans TaxID=1094342 RepID=UPI003BAD338C